MCVCGCGVWCVWSVVVCVEGLHRRGELQGTNALFPTTRHVLQNIKGGKKRKISAINLGTKITAVDLGSKISLIVSHQNKIGARPDLIAAPYQKPCLSSTTGKFRNLRTSYKDLFTCKTLENLSKTVKSS